LVEGVMATGVIKFFNDQAGYGFVIPDEGGADIYVNWRGCRENYLPAKDDRVDYRTKEFPGGRSMAVNVSLIESAA
jgi:CspA family cold shock protein